MVVVNCPACHKNRLLGLESITDLVTTNVGMAFDYRCPCGGGGTILLRRHEPFPV